MGWSGVHKPKYVTTVEFLKNNLSTCEGIEIVDSAMTYDKVVFAIRDIKKDYIYALIYLVRFSKDYFNLTYKSMDEFAGPGVTCPKKILKLLTPLDEISKKEPELSLEYIEWARSWRETSQKNLHDNPPIKNGDIIETEKTINFTNGYSCKHFKMINRRLYMINPKEPNNPIGRVRFNPRKGNYKVLTPQEIGKFISVSV